MMTEDTDIIVKVNLDLTTEPLSNPNTTKGFFLACDDKKLIHDDLSGLFVFQ